MDLQLFQLINNLAGKNDVLDFLGIFFASYAIWLMIFLILALGFLPPHKQGAILTRMNAARAVLAGLLGWGMARGLGLFFYRPRPYVSFQVNKLIEQLFAGKSFPSDHTTIAFALACTIFLYNKKIGIWFLVGAALIALSRVYVGVHYPGDIFAGAILGIIFALIIKKLIPTRC
ncbi:phosphatase PAP2 family protein [Patescibacteria group bacterium]|nr:phosphatase PAP2 family protein [Patescibacteria group bacterium]MBU4511933.1 phosphatase PAP2 family protein [Patescibacteria group bacterium]MCG2692901.1 phosphatase PAP2 family protein [Candidatus Parcubacteria bacterium]